MATTKATTTQSTAQVKATQTALNQAGANLKVDGILGPKTQAALSKFGSSGGSSGSQSGGTNTPVRSAIAPVKVSSGAKSTGATSYATQTTKTNKNNIDTTGVTSAPTKDSISPSSKSNVVQYKQPLLANPFDGGFLNNLKTGIGMVGDKLKDAFSSTKSKQGANALQATLLPNAKIIPDNFIPLPTTKVGKVLASGGLPGVAKGFETLINPTPKKAAASEPTTVPNNSQNSGALSTDGQLNPDLNGTSPIYTPSSGNGTNTPVVAKTTQTDPLTGATTTLTQNIASPAVQAIVNPQTTTAITGLTDALINSKGDPFMSKGTKSEFQNNQIVNYQNNVAKLFNNPQDVVNSYNTDSTFKAQIDKAAVSKGVDPQSIISGISSKVTPAVNGITQPQTTADFLANNSAIPSSINKAMNESIALEKNFTQQQKDLYFGNDKVKGLLQQSIDDHKAMVDSITAKEARLEESERSKAQLAIDKANAEFQQQDAELELQRETAKSNLTEFLAHIGALNTDGNAGVGLANLEAKYQAARSKLRSNFDVASREINMNMNDHINELQSNRDDNVIKLNMDLSKTEREIAVDVMKLDYNLNKDIIDAKLKYAEKVQAAKEKAASKAQSLNKDWTSAFFTTAAGNNAADLFKSLPKDFQNEWIKNAPSWGAGTTGGKANLQSLTADYSNYSKNNPTTKNYTASNIPDTLVSSLNEDIQAGATYKDLVSLYPEVSTAYLNSLFNNLK